MEPEEKQENKQNLEKVLLKESDIKHILPFVKKTMHNFLGVTISELNEDLSTKLNKSPLINIEIHFNLSYKNAKKLFKKEFITRLLQINLANVSEAAKVAEIDRRSIHRIIQESKINIRKLRKDLIKPSYIKKIAVSAIVEDVLKQYQEVIHPVKLEKVYKNVDRLSSDLSNSLPETKITLKQAEDYFDSVYLKAALEKENYSITKTAKKIGIRYETLYRKIKKLNLIS